MHRSDVKVKRVAARVAMVSVGMGVAVALGATAFASNAEHRAAVPVVPDAGSIDLARPFGGKRVGVVDSDGKPVGYISAEAEAASSTEGFPALRLGSGAVPVTGTEVVDDTGRRVGYYLTWVGFIDLETAQDPAAVDRLVIADRDLRTEAEAEAVADLRTQVMGTGDGS